MSSRSLQSWNDPKPSTVSYSKSDILHPTCSAEHCSWLSYSRRLLLQRQLVLRILSTHVISSLKMKRGRICSGFYIASWNYDSHVKFVHDTPWSAHCHPSNWQARALAPLKWKFNSSQTKILPRWNSSLTRVTVLYNDLFSHFHITSLNIHIVQ